MINAVLKNNLELQHKENEYIKYRTKANTIYALVTMIISFVASIMFNINNYLPMIGCITFCIICFILSWYMVDYSKDDKKIIENNKEKNTNLKEDNKQNNVKHAQRRKSNGGKKTNFSDNTTKNANSKPEKTSDGNS